MSHTTEQRIRHLRWDLEELNRARKLAREDLAEARRKVVALNAKIEAAEEALYQAEMTMEME